MQDKNTPPTVYIVFQNHDGNHSVMGVYATRKAANAEAKRLREYGRLNGLTFPIIAYEVEGADEIPAK